MKSLDSLEEHRGGFLPLTHGGARLVDNLHLNLVHDLHGCNWNTGSHDLGCSGSSIANSGKGDNGNASLLRNDCKLERDLRHDTQCALGADEKVGKVVSCRRFPTAFVKTHRFARGVGRDVPWPTARLDYGAISEHHRQIDYPVLHSAIADCIGPTGCKLACALLVTPWSHYLQLVPTIPPILACAMCQ